LELPIAPSRSGPGRRPAWSRPRNRPARRGAAARIRRCRSLDGSGGLDVRVFDAEAARDGLSDEHLAEICRLVCRGCDDEPPGKSPSPRRARVASKPPSVVTLSAPIAASTRSGRNSSSMRQASLPSLPPSYGALAAAARHDRERGVARGRYQGPAQSERQVARVRVARPAPPSTTPPTGRWPPIRFVSLIIALGIAFADALRARMEAQPHRARRAHTMRSSDAFRSPARLGERTDQLWDESALLARAAR
jgi:hypothetical protein